jgi:hypothetical protein
MFGSDREDPSYTLVDRPSGTQRARHSGRTSQSLSAYTGSMSMQRKDPLQLVEDLPEGEAGGHGDHFDRFGRG